MSSKLESLRAQLALAEVEEEYAQAKEAYRKAMDAFVDERVDNRPSGMSATEAGRLARSEFLTADVAPVHAYHDAKSRLHTQRAEFRMVHRITPDGPGDASAQPEPIAVSAAVKGA